MFGSDICQVFCTRASRRTQTKRQRNPCAAVENKIDPDKQTDHPKPRRRPLRKNKEAQYEGDDAIGHLPDPIPEAPAPPIRQFGRVRRTRKNIAMNTVMTSGTDTAV